MKVFALGREVLQAMLTRPDLRLPAVPCLPKLAKQAPGELYFLFFSFRFLFFSFISFCVSELLCHPGCLPNAGPPGAADLLEPAVPLLGVPQVGEAVFHRGAVRTPPRTSAAAPPAPSPPAEHRNHSPRPRGSVRPLTGKQNPTQGLVFGRSAPNRLVLPYVQLVVKTIRSQFWPDTKRGNRRASYTNYGQKP